MLTLRALVLCSTSTSPTPSRENTKALIMETLLSAQGRPFQDISWYKVIHAHDTNTDEQDFFQQEE
jgi:hypothetical protein